MCGQDVNICLSFLFQQKKSKSSQQLVRSFTPCTSSPRANSFFSAPTRKHPTFSYFLSFHFASSLTPNTTILYHSHTFHLVQTGRNQSHPDHKLLKPARCSLINTGILPFHTDHGLFVVCSSIVSFHLFPFSPEVSSAIIRGPDLSLPFFHTASRTSRSPIRSRSRCLFLLECQLSTSREPEILLPFFHPNLKDFKFIITQHKSLLLSTRD